MSTLGTDLDKINEQLEGITDYIDKLTQGLEGKSQEFINERMNKLSAEISEKLNNIKKIKIVLPLHAQYLNATSQVAVLQPLVGIITALLSLNPGNLGEALSAINSIRDALVDTLKIVIAPYYPAASYLEEIVPKVIELGDNVQKVATYQPTIPNIDVPPLNVDVSLSIQDIISG